MLTKQIIRAIQVWDYCPGFRDGPYVMSHVVQHSIHGRILAIRTNQEVLGLGEIVFPPSVPEAARLIWFEAEEDYLSGLIGCEIESIRSLCQEIRRCEDRWNGVAFGLETAYWDIQGKQKQQSLSELLGGRQNVKMDDYFSISEQQKEGILQRLKAAGSDRKVIQLKLGIGTLEEDVDKVSLCLGTMTPNQVLLADANGGWSVEDACQIIDQFNDDRIYWEEPCRSYEDNVEVIRSAGKPVMLDQCIAKVDLALRAIQDNVAAAICIKPAFLGGLETAREIRDLCIGSKIKIRIDGPWCGDIATAAILHLASGTPRDLLVSSCDLREPLVLPQNLQGARTIRPGRVDPPDGDGLGIQFDPRLMGQPETMYGV